MFSVMYVLTAALPA